MSSFSAASSTSCSVANDMTSLPKPRMAPAIGVLVSTMSDDPARFGQR